MRRRGTRTRAAATAVALAALLAGCGGGDDDDSDRTDAPPATSAGDGSDDPVAGDHTGQNDTDQNEVDLNDVGENVTSQGIGIALASSGGVAGGPVEVTVELTNHRDSAVTVVQPFVMPNFVSFRVTDADGQRQAFVGPQPRLRPIGDDRFAELAPGESLTRTFDLSAGYELEAGTYSVWAEYLNPSAGTHEGTRAVVFEPGEGPTAAPISIEVSP